MNTRAKKLLDNFSNRPLRKEELAELKRYASEDPEVSKKYEFLQLVQHAIISEENKKVAAILKDHYESTKKGVAAGSTISKAQMSINSSRNEFEKQHHIDSKRQSPHFHQKSWLKFAAIISSCLLISGGLYIFLKKQGPLDSELAEKQKKSAEAPLQENSTDMESKTEDQSTLPIIGSQPSVSKELASNPISGSIKLEVIEDSGFGFAANPFASVSKYQIELRDQEMPTYIIKNSTLIVYLDKEYSLSICGVPGCKLHKVTLEQMGNRTHSEFKLRLIEWNDSEIAEQGTYIFLNEVSYLLSSDGNMTKGNLNLLNLPEK